MLMIASICMLCAAVIFSIGVFFAKNKAWSISFQILTNIALICLAITSSIKVAKFNLYTILICVAFALQMISIYIPKSKQTLQNDDEKKKVSKSEIFEVIKSATNLIISAVLGVCGLYLGLEKAYGYLLGACLAGCFIFVCLGIGRKYKLLDLLCLIFDILAIGIVVAQIPTVLIYSQSIKNIMFCLACVIFANYIILKRYKDQKLANIAFYLSALLFVGVILL